jgi:DNA-binding transcriptional ArsR family regulator
MAKYLSELDQLFQALSDGTRRAIVERLVHSPASVSTLAEPFDAALPTIVAHLRVLERAGIVSSEKVGRVRTYQLVPDALVPANHWIVDQRRPQERRLDRLGEHLARRADTQPPPPTEPPGATT